MDAYNENGGMIDLQILGRYIALIQLDKNEKNAQMIFYDAENNEEFALGIATSLMFSGGDGKMNENYMKHFMQKFNELKPFYKQNYGFFKLILGEAEIN